MEDKQILEGKGWVKEKPVWKKECILLTATWIRDKWDYSSFYVVWLDMDYTHYWALCELDGEEWGDIGDLQADLYKVIQLPNQIQTKRND